MRQKLRTMLASTVELNEIAGISTAHHARTYLPEMMNFDHINYAGNTVNSQSWFSGPTGGLPGDGLKYKAIVLSIRHATCRILRTKSQWTKYDPSLIDNYETYQDAVWAN